MSGFHCIICTACGYRGTSAHNCQDNNQKLKTEKEINMNFYPQNPDPGIQLIIQKLDQIILLLELKK